MTTPAARPGARYGDDRPSRRPGLVAAAVVLTTAVVGWVIWAALGAAAPHASGDVTGFEVHGADSIQVRLVLGGDAGPVSCTVQALDRTREVVGVTTARGRVGSDGRAETTVTIRTRTRPVTAVVDACVAGSG